eukprot:TRINITY_DN35471_c0_g1_i1.p1 TRINITY_DN35471_c0_g1~~TRINITY_DN35471_c0_g1_i1.p1  ORF type:complete len:435 (+),score=59.85 TRINITY_DN35471_c0_g1_i1:242-1546(+)
MQGLGDRLRIPDPYIPGLPDDLGIQCLLRLRRVDQGEARKVCKRWFNFVQGDAYYKMRRLSHLDEAWLYVLTRDAHERLWWHALDPSTRRWHPIAKMPCEASKAYGVASEACEGKLYVIGGAGTWAKPPREEVLRYDPARDEWSRAASLGTPRCYMGSGVLNGRVYVAGGIGDSSLTSVEVYNPDEDRWTYGSNLVAEVDVENSVVWDGKLHIAHVRCDHLSEKPHAQSYDPQSDTWSLTDTPMSRGLTGPTAVLGGALYMISGELGGVKLVRYERTGGKEKARNGSSDCRTSTSSSTCSTSSTCNRSSTSSSSSTCISNDRCHTGNHPRGDRFENASCERACLGGQPSDQGKKPEEGSWQPIGGRLSAALLDPPCRLVGLGRKLYILGRGCRALEVDLRAAEEQRGEGMLLTRQVEGTGCASDMVVSCHVLSL